MMHPVVRYLSCVVAMQFLSGTTLAVAKLSLSPTTFLLLWVAGIAAAAAYLMVAVRG